MPLGTNELISIVIIAVLVAAVAAYAIWSKGLFRIRLRRGDEGTEVDVQAGAAQAPKSTRTESAGERLGDIKEIETFDHAKIEGSNVNVQIGHSQKTTKTTRAKQ